MKRLAGILAIFVCLSGNAEAADNKNIQRRLSLTATGEVKSAPDMAVIRLGVVREARTAGEAVRANTAAMEQVLAVVLQSGVAEKDVQTSGFSVNPRYVYPPRPKNGPQKPPRIVGYTVSNNLAVIVRNLENVGYILDAVVSSGSNRISGITFGIQKPEPLRNEARKQAVAAVIAKAKLYAKAAGFELGRIISLREQGGVRRPRPVYAQAAVARSYRKRAVPVARGEQSVTSQVSVVWEIR